MDNSSDSAKQGCKMFNGALRTLCLVAVVLVVAALIAGCGSRKQGARDHKDKAVELVSQSKYEKALDVLCSAEDEYPDDADIQQLKASILAKLGRIRECEETIVRATSLGTNCFALCVHIGDTLISDGKREEGCKLYVKALKCGTNEPVNLLYLGGRLSEFGLAVESAEAFLRLALLTVDDDRPIRRQAVAREMEEVSCLFRYAGDSKAANATLVLGAQFIDEQSREEGDYPTLPRSEIVKLANELLRRVHDIPEEKLHGYQTGKEDFGDLFEGMEKANLSLDFCSQKREAIEKSFDEVTEDLEKQGKKEAAEMNRRLKLEALRDFDEQQKRKAAGKK